MEVNVIYVSDATGFILCGCCGANRRSLLKTWELMYLCASAMPPGKEFGAYLSEYVHEVANAPMGDSALQMVALNTWNALKRSVKGGPRRVIPAQEEVEALLVGRKLTTIAFFLDETFEEITYDMTTTVSDAVEVGPPLGLPVMNFYVHALQRRVVAIFFTFWRNSFAGLWYGPLRKEAWLITSLG